VKTAKLYDVTQLSVASPITSILPLLCFQMLLPPLSWSLFLPHLDFPTGGRVFSQTQTQSAHARVQPFVAVFSRFLQSQNNSFLPRYLLLLVKLYSDRKLSLRAFDPSIVCQVGPSPQKVCAHFVPLLFSCSAYRIFHTTHLAAHPYCYRILA
jgi:hypothetical protein